MIQPGLAVVNEDGTPKWRMAPSPHGPYWEEGMKLGYQDSRCLDLAEEHAARAPQGGLAVRAVCVRRRPSRLKKTLVGLTPIRNSDLNPEP